MLCRSKIPVSVKDDIRIQVKAQACIHQFRSSWSSWLDVKLSGQCSKTRRKQLRQE